ncbi:MAG: efflux RND transporter periplasmic adaptor subunit [Gammaproteobacteria bacterium]|nr:MAG: efflux RND transporter periplasmic adaptor subunit [Gammaproteobacteria bacterium]
MNRFTLTLLAVVITLGGCAQETEKRTWNLASVQQRDIIVSVQAAGIIEPVTTVELKSKASGEILAISADTGDVVEAGQLLVQIDKRTPRNALAQADAELEAANARRDIAKLQRERAATLFKTGTLNQVDHEQSILEYANSKAEVVRAQVAVENARIALDDTEVRAPSHGTIILREIEVGQVISSPTMDVGGGTALLRMADLRFVQVRALVDETDIGKILPGQKAVVTVAAYPNQPFDGSVLKIEPQAEEEESVTLFAVIITIDNKSGLLRPGMNAEVELNIASRYGVPAIPTIALRTPRDIEAAALFTGMEEAQLRAQLRSSGMAVPDMVSGASEATENDAVDNATDSDTNKEAYQDKEAATLTTSEIPSQLTAGQGYMFGGQYWIFVLRDGRPAPQYINAGLTDLDYSEVLSGVDANEQIILLPSSALIMSQNEFREWMGKAVGLPGMSSDKDD